MPGVGAQDIDIGRIPGIARVIDDEYDDGDGGEDAAASSGSRMVHGGVRDVGVVGLGADGALLVHDG